MNYLMPKCKSKSFFLIFMVEIDPNSTWIIKFLIIVVCLHFIVYLQVKITLQIENITDIYLRNLHLLTGV